MKRILFIMTIVSMGLFSCVGGTQHSSSEPSTETKKECCSSEKAEKECSSEENKKECCSSKEAKKECSSEENKKECCSSKKDSTQSNDNENSKDHNHDQYEE